MRAIPPQHADLSWGLACGDVTPKAAREVVNLTQSAIERALFKLLEPAYDRAEPPTPETIRCRAIMAAMAEEFEALRSVAADAQKAAIEHRSTTMLEGA